MTAPKELCASIAKILRDLADAADRGEIGATEFQAQRHTDSEWSDGSPAVTHVRLEIVTSIRGLRLRIEADPYGPDKTHEPQNPEHVQAMAQALAAFGERDE